MEEAQRKSGEGGNTAVGWGSQKGILLTLLIF